VNAGGWWAGGGGGGVRQLDSDNNTSTARLQYLLGRIHVYEF
jgi:hypothetical protein